MTPEVVVAGHICLDVIPELPTNTPAASLLTPGKLTVVGPAAVSTGGAVANTGLALHKLGTAVRLVGKVGEDPLGAALLDVLRRISAPLAEGMIVAPGESSSYTVVMNLPGADRAFLHHPGANDTFAPQDLKDEHLRGARWFHFGYPPLMRGMRAGDGDALRALFQQAKAQGLHTSLDMAYVDPASDAAETNWPLLLEKVLPHVDVFLPSLDEIAYMFGVSLEGGITPSAIRDIAARLIALGTGMAALKLGHHGLYLRTADDARRLTGFDAAQWTGRELYTPCFQVTEAGATGSGDCTIAGFIAGALRGLPPAEVILGAAGTGACCVERPDATSGIIPWAALQDRIAGGWQQHAGTLTFPGMAHDTRTGVWQTT
jgi:sugar/nucleoside kinase (ribokinase family)